jgi:ribosomal protein S18 acetylase RimI-like enzyme
MTLDVRVRAARADDLAAIGRLTVDAYVEDGFLGPDHPYVVELGDAAGRNEHGEVLVAVDDGGTVLGSVTVANPGTPLASEISEGELTFRMLAVAPSARRRGAGRALVEAVIAQAAELRVRRIVIFSGELMTAAHRIYLTHGFRRLPERDLAAEDQKVWAFALELPAPKPPRTE